MKRLLVGLLLFATGWCSAQEVKLPAEVRGPVGSFIVVTATTTDTLVKWHSVDSGLNLFPPQLLRDSKIAVVTALVPGRYRLLAVSAKSDTPSDFAQCVVVIGDAPPGPNPPQPAPPVTPTTGAMRVLILYESAPEAAEVNRWRVTMATLNSPTLRAYLSDKCIDPRSPTSGPQWRAYDQHASLANLPAEWQTLRSKAGTPTALPWVVVESFSSGVVFNAPLPDVTEAGALAFFKQFGG